MLFFIGFFQYNNTIMYVKLRQTFLILKILIFVNHFGFSRCDKAYIDGDMYIVGLFDVFNGQDGSCLDLNTDSVMVLEATRWYTGQLNKANVLPFKIGKVHSHFKSQLDVY